MIKTLLLMIIMTVMITAQNIVAIGGKSHFEDKYKAYINLQKEQVVLENTATGKKIIHHFDMINEKDIQKNQNSYGGRYLYYKDLDFDGVKDFALIQDADCLKGFGYKVYLDKGGKLIYDKTLSHLSQCFMFEIDKQNKVYTTYDSVTKMYTKYHWVNHQLRPVVFDASFPCAPISQLESKLSSSKNPAKLLLRMGKLAETIEKKTPLELDDYQKNPDYKNICHYKIVRSENFGDFPSYSGYHYFQILKQYPDSDLVDDAAFALIYVITEEAYNYSSTCIEEEKLKAFLKQYPKSNKAKEAKERIREIIKEGCGILD